MLHNQPSHVMLRIINPRLREIKESDGEAMLAAMIDKLPENDRKTSRTCYTGPLNGSRSIPKTLAIVVIIKSG